MPITAPFFETVSIPKGRSLLVFDRRLPEFPFNWHYHPEFELTLTVGSEGMRFVGDHVERYGDGDLVLIAPNVPHAFQSGTLLHSASSHRAVVSWFTKDWAEGMIQALPELQPVSELLEQSRRGLLFGPKTSNRVREQILDLGRRDPLGQLLTLQAVLAELAFAPDSKPLASGEVSVSDLPRDRERIEKVLDHLHEHYDRPVRLRPLCDLVHLTESQLQRVFKRSTRMSISGYIGQLRLGKACQMLVNSDLPVGRIASDCGFSDAADLARRFRAARGVSPTTYRASFRRS